MGPPTVVVPSEPPPLSDCALECQRLRQVSLSHTHTLLLSETLLVQTPVSKNERRNDRSSFRNSKSHAASLDQTSRTTIQSGRPMNGGRVWDRQWLLCHRSPPRSAIAPSNVSGCVKSHPEHSLEGGRASNLVLCKWCIYFSIFVQVVYLFSGKLCTFFYFKLV